MRKIYSLVFVALFLMAASLSYGQAVQVSPFSISTTVGAGAQCSGGQIHDDGTAENGYGWNASAGNPSGWCTKFIPTVYPYKFTKFCIGLTKNGTVTNWTFRITMWKSVNGMPGPIMDSTTVTATGVPTWPTVTFFDFLLPASWANVTGTDSVFIGIMTNPITMTGVFVGGDETVATPLWPGYGTVAAGPWTPFSTYFATYRAFLMRAEGQAAGPAITHTPLPNSQNVAGPYVVNANILPAGTATITSAKVFWSRNSVTITDSVTMTNSGSNYSGSIPGNGTNATYRYYIKAIESDGLVGVHPSGAPATLHLFTVTSVDPTPPVIVHTPIGPTPKTMWPVAVTATVTDNLGVDSAWVRWYKTSAPATVKQFKILNTSGNTYSALFNSVNADVNPGDVINYRIIAQDNSTQHNRDSTALHSFPIIALVTACVGTGTTASNYPFTTFWMDGRTQMLFTAAELLAAGGAANYNIIKVGYNVISAAPQVMNGFNVKFQATTLTSLTGFVTTGTWVTGFSGTYSVPGTGPQNIDMTAPYYTWNGTSNLIVEVCYDNTSYTSYSTVNATSAPGMTWGYYTDNAVGCTMGGGATQSIRPNTCFTMTPATGITPIGTVLPTVYSLSQNYPNPFNPVTKISFALPEQGFVSLKIYDVLGREVRTLVNEVKTAGNFSVDFNASEFSSGVYFYRLESKGFSDIKRMMLIK